MTELSNRYVVGEQKPFINFDFTYSRTGNKTDNRGHVALPDILFGEKIESINVEVLTVSEIYEVTSNDGSTATGFIMKDKNDVIWHNQYPTANYGQMVGIQDDVVMCPSKDHIAMYDALKYLDGLQRTSRRLDKIFGLPADLRVPEKLISAHYFKVMKMIEEITGKLVVCRPFIFKTIDGEETLYINVIGHLLV